MGTADPTLGQNLLKSRELTSQSQDFMTAVSLQCKIKNHHPEWSNVRNGRARPRLNHHHELTGSVQVYNTTFIRWTTHSPPGLSAKDTELAAICDGYAQSFGEVKEEAAPAAGSSSSPDGQSCQLKGLADHVASTSGDCCTPPKKSS